MLNEKLKSELENELSRKDRNILIREIVSSFPKKRGRKAFIPPTETIHIRIRKEKKLLLQKDAELKGKKFSAYVREKILLNV